MRPTLKQEYRWARLNAFNAARGEVRVIDVQAFVRTTGGPWPVDGDNLALYRRDFKP